MADTTLKRLARFAGDGRDYHGSYHKWVADRRDAITTARDAGHTMSEIGAALGLSRQRIHQIIHYQGGRAT